MSKIVFTNEILSMFAEKTEENVILLYLSTLNREPEMNHYQKADLHFNGLVQLEPGTKYFLTKLAEKGKKADRIIMLETPETRKKLAEFGENYSAKWDREKTAAEIYKARILAFLNGNEPYRAGQADVWFEEIKLSPDIRYTEEELEKLFVEIEIENGKMYFPKMIGAIQSKTEGMGVDLYIDMQGGDRSAVAQINAITELMRDQKVTVKERIAIRFQKGNKTQLIEDVGEQFRSYELITAMNVFKRYGWGNELVAYFKDDKSKEVRNLVEAVQKASQAIKLCDVGGFDEAICYIEKLGSKIKPAGTSEMDIVYQDIYEDFKPLFNPEHRYVAQIRWCLKKNFVQQALTILESKMPTEYVRSGLKYYCDREEDAAKLMDAAAEACFSMPQSRNQFKDINHYFICCQNNPIYRPIWQEKYGLENRDSIDQNIKEYEKIRALRNGANHADDKREGRFIRYAKEKYPKKLTFENAGSKGIPEKVLRYLDAFETLAQKVPAEIRESVIDLG